VEKRDLHYSSLLGDTEASERKNFHLDGQEITGPRKLCKLIITIFEEIMIIDMKRL
jgi:hypothetical protein